MTVIKAKLILTAALLLAFLAGGSVGVLVTRSRQVEPHRSWLTSELGLTSAQSDQMRRILSEARGATSRQQADRRQALTTQRDQAIFALLSEEQRTRYEAIQRDYSQGMTELAQERRRAFDQADERIKAMLTPEQAAKYDELMKRQRDRGQGVPPESLC